MLRHPTRALPDKGHFGGAATPTLAADLGLRSLSRAKIMSVAILGNAMSETERPVEFHAATADCGLLYHYTSEEGLQGIIEHDNIRATHVRSM